MITLLVCGGEGDEVGVAHQREAMPGVVVRSQKIIGLVGVYDADRTVRGELTYWVGARLGRALLAVRDHPRIGPSAT